MLTMEPAEKGIDTAAEVKSSSSPSYCSPLAIASFAKAGSFLGAFSFITGSLLAGRASSAASTALSSSATSSLKVGSFLSGLASCLGSLAELSSVSSAESSFASSTDSSLASSAESSLASSTDSSLASSLDSTAGLPAAPSSVDALLS